MCDKFTGHPKGFAYVEFENYEDAKTAIFKNGEMLGGRELEISKKRTNIKGYHFKAKRRFNGRGRTARYRNYTAEK